MSLSIAARSGLGLGPVSNLVFFATAIATFTALGLLLYKIRPGQRGILELAGCSGLLSTVVQIYVTISPEAAGFFAIAVFFFILTSIWFFLHSAWARAIGARVTWRERDSCDLEYPAKLVWKHIIPGEAAPEAHCTGFVERYEDDPEEEDTLTIVFKKRRSGQAEYQITFLEKREPYFCRFYFQGNEADGTIVDGVFSCALEVVDRENCTIIANEERSGLPLGHLIERWFDNVLGYQHDRLIQMMDEKYGDGSGVTKPLAQPAE